MLHEWNLQLAHQTWRRLKRMLLSSTVLDEMQHVSFLLFFNFLSANKREPSFVRPPISPLRPFCASLWLGSKHIEGVRGVKSFAVVIMGSPLQSNHELLKTALRSAPQQCQLTSTLLWEVVRKRPTACRPEWARSSVSVCGTCLRQHGGFYRANTTTEFWMRSNNPKKKGEKEYWNANMKIYGITLATKLVYSLLINNNEVI